MHHAIDTRLERDPRYAEAAAKLAALESSLTDIQRQQTAAQAQIRGGSGADRDFLHDEAAALLSGDHSHASGEQIGATLRELEHKAKVYREAISLQRGRLSAIRSEVGGAIGRDLLPTHRANVLAIAKAAHALHQAMQAERALREPLSDADVPTSGVLCVLGGFTNPGSLDDPESPLSRYWKEAHELGLIAESELPAIVRLRASYPPPISAPDQAVEFCEPDGTLPWPDKVAALLHRKSA